MSRLLIRLRGLPNPLFGRDKGVTPKRNWLNVGYVEKAEAQTKNVPYDTTTHSKQHVCVV